MLDSLSIAKLNRVPASTGPPDTPECAQIWPTGQAAQRSIRSPLPVPGTACGAVLIAVVTVWTLCGSLLACEVAGRLPMASVSVEPG